jgi:hypothetical protein
MYDSSLVIEIFESIDRSLGSVQQRFEIIHSVEDFVKDETGLDPAENTGQENWKVFV